jgi:hypothetical protein
MILLLTEHYYGDEIKVNVGACCTHGKEMRAGLSLEDLTERDLVENFAIYGMIILKWILKNQNGRVDLIRVVWDMDQ